MLIDYIIYNLNVYGVEVCIRVFWFPTNSKVNKDDKKILLNNISTALLFLKIEYVLSQWLIPYSWFVEIIVFIWCKINFLCLYWNKIHYSSLIIWQMFVIWYT